MNVNYVKWDIYLLKKNKYLFIDLNLLKYRLHTK